jgi:hypothetical protein
MILGMRPSTPAQHRSSMLRLCVTPMVTRWCVLVLLVLLVLLLLAS